MLEGWLHQCEDLVDRLGIFSPNEELEDIHTADIKYLLVPALRGDLLSNSEERDVESRAALLHNALCSYSRLSPHPDNSRLSQDLSKQRYLTIYAGHSLPLETYLAYWFRHTAPESHCECSPVFELDF